MKTYRAAIVGCGRMGAFIDNEVKGTKNALLPYSHAAGFEVCERTELVAGSGRRSDVMAAFGQRYGVSAEHRYADWRVMVDKERPDILSIATQPEPRTEIALFAIERGVPAIYAEKPLCSTIAEANALVAAVEKHGVVFNMGTNRRWHPGFERARELIESGEIGALKTLLIFSSGTLFNMSSHWFDLAMYLNRDVPVLWAQGHLPQGAEQIQGDEVVADPPAQGMFAFQNGVMGHVMLSPRANEVQMICERGYITARQGGAGFELHRQEIVEQDSVFTQAPFPAFTPRSPVLRLIEDLVQGLDTGKPTQGGVRVAAANTQLIFGFIESHLRGGQRVELPLAESRLRFHRPGFKSHPPKFA